MGFFHNLSSEFLIRPLFDRAKFIRGISRVNWRLCILVKLLWEIVVFGCTMRTTSQGKRSRRLARVVPTHSGDDEAAYESAERSPFSSPKLPWGAEQYPDYNRTFDTTPTQ
ncbi:hypothetical protein C5167_031506 [Papaver somniferum]|uniref:Uncharacterized protein n=1 Tax=Papaver somniferum TaxID=3469 RepID=A0A4Y7K8J1_PAPSO|nr:hypothetical protein C5167_031506 [Papaver somniferum]